MVFHCKMRCFPLILIALFLQISVAPLAPEFESFSGLFDDGETRSIMCHSNGSRPAANIYWILNGTRINSTTSQVVKDSDGTYFVQGTLVRHLTRSMENTVLSCVVTNEVLQKTNAKTLSQSVMLLPNCKL